MKYIIQFLRSIFAELCILFIYVFLLNNYIGNADKTINADGIGYYDYLPSAFIHHDFVRKDLSIEKDSAIFSRIKTLLAYNNYDHHKVNKYPCGTALLELPFFTYTYLTTKNERSVNDGFQAPYQETIFYAALFYLLLSLFLLKKVLTLYEIKPYLIIISQVLLTLATSITHYANFDAGFSHIYSLFAICAFVYFTKSYFLTKNINAFLYACAFLGLVILLRQINIIIILFIPFLAGNYLNLKDGVNNLLKNSKKIVLGCLIIALIFSIQCLCWYLQTGHIFIYSYQGESFNFLKPEFFNILFSFKKGLFIYTPVLFVCCSGIIWLIYKKQYYLVLTWISFFIVLTYVLSSWWCWYYGASYGLRAYIDFFPIFFVLFAMMLNDFKLRIVPIVLSAICIPLNLIQTYQYKEFILDWENMNKKKYSQVFLKTAERYKGLLWKREYDYQNYLTVKEIDLGTVDIKENTEQMIYSIKANEITCFEKVSLIQVSFENEFAEESNTRIILSIIDDSKKVHYSHNPFLIHFSEKPFYTMHTGLYNFEVPSFKTYENKTIMLNIHTSSETNKLTNLKLNFFATIGDNTTCN